MSQKSNKLAPIAAITFDLDDTLWPILPTILRAEEILHHWLTENCPRLSLEQTEMAQLRQEVIARHPAIAHDFSALRKVALREVLLPAGYDQPTVEAAFDVFFAARHEVTLFEDSLPCLQQLGRQFRLGAISNGNAELERVGLSPHFEFAINARGVGKAKPHPMIFAAAIERFDLPAHQILHVGDHPKEDVDGALDAGMQAIWLNRSGQVKPHARAQTVASLAELAALIALP